MTQPGVPRSTSGNYPHVIECGLVGHTMMAARVGYWRVWQCTHCRAIDASDARLMV